VRKKVQVIIPFRQREGSDLRRAANLEVVQAWWYAHGFDPAIVDDGLGGDAQFNRHAAYNAGVAANIADVYVFAEADMLIHPSQINKAVGLAEAKPGIVVPFTEYRYLSDSVTKFVRDTVADMDDSTLAEWWALPPDDPSSVFDLRPESTMLDGKSIGAVTVLSRSTYLTAGGFTEATRGNWYDDNITEEAYAYLVGKTRWVRRPAVHLYHLPGWKGGHLTDEDREATQSNKAILDQMRRNIRHKRREPVRDLMRYRAR